MSAPRPHSPRSVMGMVAFIRRTQIGVLDARGEREADGDFAIYVAPRGGGLHTVKKVCNDQAYTVGGPYNFKKGAVVLTMGSNGLQGEVIITQPPHLIGASKAPIRHDYSNYPFGLTDTPACPVLEGGDNYIGFGINPAGTLKAWAYATTVDDPYTGVRGAELGSVSLASVDDYTGEFFYAGSQTVVFKATRVSNGRACIVSWTVGGALQLNELHSSMTDVDLLSFVLSGSSVYLHYFDPPDWFPMVAPVGGSGSDGAGITNSLGSVPPGPIGIDLSGGTDPSPLVSFAVISGTVYPEFAESPSGDTLWYAWVNDPLVGVKDWGADTIGEGTHSVLPIAAAGSVRVDFAGSRLLIFTSTGVYRAAGLPASWVADFANDKVRGSPGGDLLQYSGGRSYYRIPAAYLVEGAVISDECAPPIIVFDAMPSVAQAPDMYPLD